MVQRKTIAVSPETHEQLEALKDEIYGTEHATYNELIKNLISEYEEDND